MVGQVNPISTWDYRFLDLARTVSTWSKDPSTKVGAVITDSHNRVISLGFNGFPRKVSDSLKLYIDKGYKHQIVLHAETNAIMFSTGSLDGATIYTSYPTCAHCAAQIIQSGIKRVVYQQLEKANRWTDSSEIADALYKQANVTVSVIPFGESNVE